jgi:hypothetical protein
MRPFSAAAGTNLVHSASRELERQAGDLERIARNLAAHVQSAHDRKPQGLQLWFAGIAGAAIAVVLLRALPRVLPFLSTAGSPASSWGRLSEQRGIARLHLLIIAKKVYSGDGMDSPISGQRR